ncbi:iron ABC transporter permease [Lentisphaerota bacterium WC36G]|nr:iron ABC transporter permease [Lentisphaerae bacterium WC36]
MICGVLFGDTSLSFAEIFDDSTINQLIVKLRVERVCFAFVIGMALSVAGLIYQAILRNQLAEPAILGVSSGAGLGACIMIFTGISLKYPITLSLGAFAGGTVAITIVLILCTILNARKLFSINLAILIGVIVSNLFSSLLMTIIALVPAGELNSVSWWLLGNLDGGNCDVILILLLVTFFAVLASCLWGRELNLLSIDQKLSYNVGLNNMAITVSFLLVASLLASLAVANSGIIGFVGLIVPHIVKIIWGQNLQKVVWIVAFFGGFFLVFCDLLSRIIIENRPLPIGIITAFFGGIFFIYLLFKEREVV